MHTLFPRMTTQLALVWAASVVPLSAGLSLAMAEPAEVTAEYRLTGLCLVGSILGAFLAVSILPPKKTAHGEVALSPRELAFHFFSSSFAGLAFTPAIMQRLDVARNGDMVLGVSAAVALFAVVGIGALAPRVVKYLQNLKK